MLARSPWILRKKFRAQHVPLTAARYLRAVLPAIMQQRRRFRSASWIDVGPMSHARHDPYASAIKPPVLQKKVFSHGRYVAQGPLIPYQPARGRHPGAEIALP